MVLIKTLQFWMDDYAEIHISELGIKSRSKKELYDLLWNEGGIYFPPIADANHKYISKVIVGDKLHLKWRNIHVCRIPHLKGLTVKNQDKIWRREGKYFRLPSRLRIPESAKLIVAMQCPPCWRHFFRLCAAEAKG